MRKLVGRWDTIHGAPENMRPGVYRAKPKNLDILSTSATHPFIIPGTMAWIARSPLIQGRSPSSPVGTMRLLPHREDCQI